VTNHSYAPLLQTIEAPAYVTDRDNRVLGVNHAYARLVGDPIAAGLRQDDLFVINLLLGPYRERFPRRAVEVPGCAATFASEVECGRLSLRTRYLWGHALRADATVARLARQAVLGDYEPRWDGMVVFRSEDGRYREMRETVVPLLADAGASYLNLWFDASNEVAAPALDTLTPREREIASLYALGHSSQQVADIAGISLNTARDHRDNIYSKLGVRSRVELTRLVLPG
jgi:DNA-binding CsgD family transcriptional regulator